MTVYICCVSGFSSSILGANLKKWLGLRTDEPVFVEAASSKQLRDEGEMADVILLAPQMACSRTKFEAQFPDIPILNIDSRDYGLGRVEKIGQDILAVLKTGKPDFKE